MTSVAHVAEMLWTCFGIVVGVCWTCFGNAVDMFWTGAGDISDMLWTSMLIAFLVLGKFCTGWPSTVGPEKEVRREGSSP